jgi:rubrerythrin
VDHDDISVTLVRYDRRATFIVAQIALMSQGDSQACCHKHWVLITFKYTINMNGLDAMSTLNDLSETFDAKVGSDKDEQRTTYNPFAVSSKLNFKIIHKKGNDYLQYEVSFAGLFLLTLVINIVLFFVLNEFILWSTLSLWIFFFGGNCLLSIVRLHHQLKRAIVALVRDRDAHRVSEIQQEWISNDHKCPACGYLIAETDPDCPDCGLKLQ